MLKAIQTAIVALLLINFALPSQGEGEWEVTPQSERAIEKGLQWLARNQGPSGNWDSLDMGLVAMGMLAFLSDGHMPDRGKYGPNVRRALDYLVANAKPSGLLNIASGRRDMYNHGLTVFAVSQAYGTVNDTRISKLMDKGIRFILDVQCEDGGWRYEGMRSKRGADLSLAVMQTKALRAAMDMGLDIPPDRIELALKFIRSRYKPLPGGKADGKNYGSSDPLAQKPGAFTYNGNKSTTAMAAAGAVCMQELGQYDDFRIQRSLDKVIKDIESEMPKNVRNGTIPFDAYTMQYVSQALYQVGGERWKKNFPKIRDAIIKAQKEDGSWEAGKHVSGTPGKLYGTSVAVFTLAIPNRYLPILQEGESKK